jgi:heme/copper-type cytochrome/quinol oxidase subunit 2
MIGWILIAAAIALGVAGWLVWRGAVRREAVTGAETGSGRQVGLVMGIDSVLTGVAGIVLAFL